MSARTGADGEVEVAWTWPSGNTHCAVTMGIDKCCGPTFNVRAYDDQEYAEPHFERTVHDPRAVLHALADARRVERSVPFGIASDHDGEQTVVVVFDVFATTHHDAAVHVLRRLTDADLTGHDIDAFWFPEPQDKPIDGNDRDAMTLRRSPSHDPARASAHRAGSPAGCRARRAPAPTRGPRPRTPARWAVAPAARETRPRAAHRRAH
ncbi:hypothetical protein [Cellulomonas denverensis]|uniref:hypothetical protein n=1 Tax=Cellulomonas denverensis TaxID=264297 RepID=UPI0035E4B0E7